MSTENKTTQAHPDLAVQADAELIEVWLRKG
jgi:hypothetical protein